ncbi:methyltransferase domain-containing protein [Candidatus Gottesmanbacteria bacterium]|nr:methyltransferase domain-containing protein [Candidatus Gottesmanbacteria bacterium]
MKNGQASQRSLERIWAQVPPDYYFNLNILQTVWHTRKWQVIYKLLSRQAIKPRRILEIGCSAGHLTNLLNTTYPRSKIIGIDVYEPAIQEAERRFPDVKFIMADAHALPFRSRMFDLVVCSETIEHVLNPKKVLQEMMRVLTPRGHSLIEMDSGSILFRSVWYVWTTFGKGTVWKGAHLHPFKAKELEALIIAQGYTIKQKVSSHLGMAVTFLTARQ